MLTCGDTFLIPKRGKDIEHLWIVITEPDADGNAVCVSVTAKRSYSDTTVVLSAGEHPFIKHESAIHYADARILDLEKVQAALEPTHGRLSAGAINPALKICSRAFKMAF